jgi:cytochrome c oxidase subunit II
VAFVPYKLPGINRVATAEAKAGELHVKVEGRQFYWNYIYPNGVIQVKTLTLPAQRAIKLDIDSQDVDHSWWIPSLDGKFDAIPGKTNHQSFTATRPGTYVGQCGEFCGYEHPKMVGTVKAVAPAAFERWYASEAKAQQNGTSQLGKMTFDGVCATCHGFKGQGGVGPTLQDNPVLGQAQAIRTLLLNGRGKMPAVGRGWSNRQMDALIAYLKKLPSGSGASSGG